MIKVDVQIATKNKNLPQKKQFKHWLQIALKNKIDNVEICIRLIDENESALLNKTYRHKTGPTNILSFPYEINSHLNEIQLLGDLAICAPIIEKESSKQKIDLMQHWAHIVIHGCLHLLGYTHEKPKNAKIMEQLEAEILNKIKNFTR